MTGRVISTSDKVRKAVNRIDGLDLLGDSKLCIVAFTSTKFHIFKVADEMKVKLKLYNCLNFELYSQKYGWMLSCIQNPNAVQLYVVPNLLREGIIDNFIRDLEICAAAVRYHLSQNRPFEQL